MAFVKYAFSARPKVNFAPVSTPRGRQTYVYDARDQNTLLRDLEGGRSPQGPSPRNSIMP